MSTATLAERKSHVYESLPAPPKTCGTLRESGEVLLRWLDGNDLPEYRLPRGYDIRFSRSILEKENRAAVDGQHIVPSNQLADRLFASLALTNPLYSLGTVVPTDAPSVAVALVDDDSQTGELLAEAEAVAEQAILLSRITPVRYKFGSKRVKCTRELFRDGELLIRELPRILGTRIGRISAHHFTVGTGTSQPKGVLTAATNSSVTTAGASPTDGELLDLMFSVDAAYHASPSCGFMLAPATYLAAVKAGVKFVPIPDELRVYDGPYPANSTFHGKPVWFNSSMPTAAGSKAVIYGDFTRFAIAADNVLFLQQLDELYAENRLVGFHAYARLGGDLVDTAAVKYLTLAA